MSSINPVSRSMNGIKTIEASTLIFTDDNTSINTSAGIVSAQTNSTTAINNIINGISFDTSTGILTLTKEDGTTLTIDLDGRYVDVGTILAPINETIYGVKTFNEPPECSTAPTNDNQLTNKLYVSSLPFVSTGTILAPINESIFGVKTFFQTPIFPASAYVSVGTELAHTDETIYGVKTFFEPPVCNTQPTSDNQLANREYVLANAGEGSSDDRLKHKEEYITDALTTLCKLKPQKYLKYNVKNGIPNEDEEKWETGLIAQEIWYDVPELRHIVNVPKGADPKPLEKQNDIQDDPDYEKLGWTDKMCSVFYNSLSGYYIQAFKELKEKNNELEERISKLEALTHENN